MRANKNGVNKDQKDKVKKDGYNRGQHCVYCLTYHMIFVTHYRKPVINDEMSAAMKEFSNHSGTDQTVYLWDDTSFWSRSYFIATTGSVSLETVKQYIESQRSEEHQAKKNQ